MVLIAYNPFIQNSKQDIYKLNINDYIAYPYITEGTDSQFFGLWHKSQLLNCKYVFIV